MREETSSLRNIRFRACLTEFSVIHNWVPISAFVRPNATSSTICNSRAVSSSCLKDRCDDLVVAAQIDKCKQIPLKSARFWVSNSPEISGLFGSKQLKNIESLILIVDVHQVVRDLAGSVVADEHVGHRFTIARGLIQVMEVCSLLSSGLVASHCAPVAEFESAMQLDLSQVLAIVLEDLNWVP